MATIREDVGEAASFIVRSLKVRGACREWSKAELALDPAGPWWSKPRDDFFGLDENCRAWILDHLETTAAQAAGCLQKKAEDRSWTWLWSQPSFAFPGKLRPSITRPDLVGGLARARCDILDLKTTSKDDLAAVVKDDQSETFLSWAGSLSVMGFTPVQCSVLSVSTAKDRRKWIEFPMPAED
ncbi:hypothetical protein [Arthrobacter pigmenti]